MIICHCNIISKADIDGVIASLLADDPWIHLTPGAVLHGLNKRGKCCSCFPTLIDVMIVTVDEIRNGDSPHVPIFADQARHAERRRWAERTLTHLRALKHRRDQRARMVPQTASGPTRGATGREALPVSSSPDRIQQGDLGSAPAKDQAEAR